MNSLVITFPKKAVNARPLLFFHDTKDKHPSARMAEKADVEFSPFFGDAPIVYTPLLNRDQASGIHTRSKLF
jgi:hypothetical protein